MVDFCYSTFKLNEYGEASEKVTREFIETAIHELGHVLGVSSDDMPFYYDRMTGLPRTPRPISTSNDIVCVNGEKPKKDIFIPSKNTLKFGALYPGIRYYEVVTPTVKQVARNHFNCDRMDGMRLENQPTSNGVYNFLKH